MTAVLIVFLAANENKRNKMNKFQNEKAMRQRRDSATVSDAIARKTGTQKNKTGTGHQRYRYKIFEASH